MDAPTQPPESRRAGSLVDLVFNPDHREFAAVGTQQRVKLWDTAIGQEVMSRTGPGDFTAVAFDAAGTHLAAVCRDEIRIWDATPLPD